ncbi:uncharacterized protein SAPINGB_P003914 [Magnusiomyces paraingens]|uniref:Uncharacterized protein n=1 Tax=Magnusiomyces paraingens TaxID=2606893 RepID=A0A5E8BZ86_9ASCO|nr:uncharacterized protein SAPINGB_P003914 [Saprochaete ingens]VVT54115.1 unnamed protein product [Saprochaete ingens]
MDEYQSTSELENVPAEYQSHIYFYNSPPKEDGYLKASAAPSDSGHYHGEFEFLQNPSPGLDNNSVICSSNMKQLVASFHTHVHDPLGDKIPSYHPFHPSDMTIDDKGILRIPHISYDPIITKQEAMKPSHTLTSSSSNSSAYSFSLDHPTRQMFRSLAESPLFDSFDQNSGASENLRQIYTQPNANTTPSEHGDSPGAPHFARENDAASFMFASHPEINDDEEVTQLMSSFHFWDPLNRSQFRNEEEDNSLQPLYMSEESMQQNTDASVISHQDGSGFPENSEIVHRSTLIRHLTIHVQNTLRRIRLRHISTIGEYQTDDSYTNHTNDIRAEEENEIPIYSNNSYTRLGIPEDEEEFQAHRGIRRYLRGLWTSGRSPEDSGRRLFSRERRRAADTIFGSLGESQDVDNTANSIQRGHTAFFGFSRFSRGDS